MHPNQKLGQSSETAAARYLLSHNYQLLEQNWRFRRKEVDLIAIDKECLVIIEVKARSSNRFGEAWEFVNQQKQKFLISAANQYVEQINWQGMTRFDIIGICLNPYGLRHIEDAFYPGL
ncbi:YraN family protein [Croceimicrobium sp.]|uniref:YraN family protein n=1 Tax=Croceimicrobium sp. TaxID=2828340 RepID=UPI003BACF910